jgi:hypothetical protein
MFFFKTDWRSICTIRQMEGVVRHKK